MEFGWIALSRDDVLAAFDHKLLAVRPPLQRVPERLQETTLGDIFARLVRMNDGERHAELRRLVESMIAQMDVEAIVTITAAFAEAHPLPDVAALTIAAVIGLPDPERALPSIRELAAAIPIDATDDAVKRGPRAAEELLTQLGADANDDRACNALGFLFQAHAATSALISQMLASRTEAPVTQTRRFVLADTELAGQDLQRGDVVHLFLGSAELHFGAGRHRCPGESIAKAIATAAVATQRITESPQ